MNKAYSFPELQQKISEAQKILIALPGQPSFDQVASALSLFLSLQSSGKTIYITCPTPMTVEYNHLVGIDKITDKIQGSDLIISFDYPADQIEKVSYNDDNGKPNLIIQVKNNAPRLNEKQARFSYAGVEVDLVIAVGIRDLKQISSISALPPNLINIGIDPNTFFPDSLNVIDPEASSFSEIALGVISGLGLPLDQDTVQNILSGIWVKTNGLTNPKVSADTYEAVAICLRLGAQRPQTTPKKAEEVSPSRRIDENKPGKQSTYSLKNVPTPQSNLQENPPSDWFEPKIFKGSNV